MPTSSKDEFEITFNFPITPGELYNMWMNSDSHSEMTGGAARISPKENEEFMTWDNYITGTNLELEPGKRILQKWRTSEFEPEDEDSMLEITFTPADNGTSTKLVLKHWNIPFGQGVSYESGWDDHYFKPIMEYLTGEE